MNKYKIRVIEHENWLNSFTVGVIKIDATLWKDEYIFETDLTLKDVLKIPCVLSAEILSTEV